MGVPTRALAQCTDVAESGLLARKGLHSGNRETGKEGEATDEQRMKCTRRVVSLLSHQRPMLPGDQAFAGFPALCLPVLLLAFAAGDLAVGAALVKGAL